MPPKIPPKIRDSVACSVWQSLDYSARMHKGLARNAKISGDVPLNRYHHGFEEGLKKAMKTLVEKFGE